MLRRRNIVLLLALPYFMGLVYLLWQMRYDTALLVALAPLGIVPVYLAVTRFRDFLYFMVFTIPMSVGLKDVGGGLGLSAPAELMLLIAAVGAALVLIREGLGNPRYIRHPLFVVILLQHGWALVATLQSDATLVSFKFFFARSIFLLVFFLFFLQLFERKDGILRFFRSYLLGFSPIILYSIIKLSGMGLARRFSPEMSEPFFDDHTIFGACLAMLLPVALLLWRKDAKQERRNWPRWVVGMILFLVLAGLFLSFSRAAWMSVVFIGGFALLIRLRVSFPQVLVGLCVVVATVWYFQEPIVESMQKNENVSGKDLAETAKSVTNVNSDESNQERVNRWSCAVRMWQDKPAFGFGPGTYETFYGDYQLKAEMTRISTKEGDRGDAHSEYLTVLSEQGTVGLAIWILLIVTVIRTGMRVAYQATHVQIRRLGRAVLLGLLTFFIHAFVNSFLDLDEAASLFWGMTAVLLLLDIKYVPSAESRQF